MLARAPPSARKKDWGGGGGRGVAPGVDVVDLNILFESGVRIGEEGGGIPPD